MREMELVLTLKFLRAQLPGSGMYRVYAAIIRYRGHAARFRVPGGCRTDLFAWQGRIIGLSIFHDLAAPHDTLLHYPLTLCRAGACQLQILTGRCQTPRKGWGGTIWKA